MPPRSDTAAGKGHTTTAQRMAIVDWLSKEYNYKWVTGSLAKSEKPTSGQDFSKVGAYKSMAEYVNKICKSDWDMKTAKSRYESYLNVYKKALKDSQGTGYGVTEKDREKGITTVEAKLEKTCPLYSKMDGLFGQRQNVRPSHLFSTVRPSSENIRLLPINREGVHDNGAENFTEDVLNSDEEDETTENSTEKAFIIEPNNAGSTKKVMVQISVKILQP